MFAALSAPRRRLILGLVAAALIAVVVSTILIVSAHTSAGQDRSVPQDQPGPVLLVPGYGGSVSGLGSLATSLRAAGKSVQIVTLPDNAQGDLRDQAMALDRAVNAALASSRARSVDVIGYSAGGVVARLWARDFRGADRSRRIVSLGSPQHGTLVAQLGTFFTGVCPVACTQLAPNSELLTALNAPPETPKGPSFVSIWTTGDEVVLPPTSAEVSGAVNISVQSVCPSVVLRHEGLPTSPIVAAMVLGEVGVQPVRTYTPADCRSLSS